MSNTSKTHNIPTFYLSDEITDLNKYSTIDWSKYIPKAVSASKCECGAFKTNGIKKGQIGHSDWCPWSK